jgi:uncharacterized protein (TIGR00255 family)
MIQSMTGYGRAEIQFENKNYVLELRSLNSKGLELNARLPVYVREIEIQLKKIIGEALKRGKIDLTLNIENMSNSTAKTINVDTVNQYIEQLKDIEDGDRMELLKMALKLPDTLKTEMEDFEEEEIQMLEALLRKAIDALNGFRSDEGKILQSEFNKRLVNLETLSKEVETIDPERSTKIQEKNHIDYFKNTLENPVSNGKKLGFITQEMGREINTIGSKANHADLQKLVIQMKDELEKIKEQLLNVL